MTRETIGIDDRPGLPYWVDCHQKHRLHQRQQWHRRVNGWLENATLSGGECE